MTSEEEEKIRARVYSGMEGHGDLDPSIGHKLIVEIDRLRSEAVSMANGWESLGMSSIAEGVARIHGATLIACAAEVRTAFKGPDDV